MSTKPESVFIASVHRNLPPLSEFYRMKNNNAYVAGVADCWYSSVRDLWVEYKFLTVPARDSTIITPGLSALQIEWCTNRIAEGRNVQVIVGCKAGGVVLQPNEWSGIPCSEFRPRVVTRSQIAQHIIKETS